MRCFTAHALLRSSCAASQLSLTIHCDRVSARRLRPRDRPTTYSAPPFVFPLDPAAPCAVEGVVTPGLAASGCNGHGTHCASTVGGTAYGVAKDVTLVTVQVLSCAGSGSTTGVIAGIEWAVDDAAAHPEMMAVISMSIGGGFSTAENLAIKAAHEANVLVVVAAGNDNSDACQSSPASAPEAVTVGSTTSQVCVSRANHQPGGS